MKKIITLFVASLMVWGLITPVFAASGITASKTSVTITKGSTVKITISASECAGRVDFTSADTSIATVNQSKYWLDSKGTKSTTITIKGVKVGTTTITVTNTDVTGYNKEDLSGKTITIKVKVVANSNNSTTAEKSSNNYMAVAIEGYELNKKDDHNYTLFVAKSVTSVKLNANAADSKAMISGDVGNLTLNDGANKFEVICTAEDGTTNVIYVVVVRNSNIYVEDISSEIAVGNSGFIVIKDDDHEIPSSTIADIIANKTKITVAEYDKNGEGSYYVSVDGSTLRSEKEIKLDVTTSTSSLIDTLTNYSKGIVVKVAMGTISEGVKVGINVANFATNGTMVNVYRLNSEKNELELVAGDLLVNEDYVELEGMDASEVFITPAVFTSSVEPVTEPTQFNIWPIVAIFSLILNAVLIVVDSKRNKK